MLARMLGSWRSGVTLGAAILASTPGPLVAQSPAAAYSKRQAAFDLGSAMDEDNARSSEARARLVAHPEVTTPRIFAYIAGYPDISPEELARLVALTEAVAGPEAANRVATYWRPGGPPKGSGLVVAGAVTIGVGVVLALLGAISLAQAGSAEGEESYGKGMLGATGLGAGGVVAAIGTPTLIVGLVRRRHWKAWQAQQRVTLRPSFGRGARGTWTAGLVLRF